MDSIGDIIAIQQNGACLSNGIMSVMSREHIFPIRVGISYSFGLMGEDFSSKSLSSGEVPTIFISTSGFNNFYKSDDVKAISKLLRIEFREEEKDSIKKYFDYLVENSWDKMESFFASYGIKLPEKERVSESLSESFIEYLKGVTGFFGEIFDKYSEIVYRKKKVPMILDQILDLASEASRSCQYSLEIRDPDDPYVYLSFSDVEEAIEMELDDEEGHPLKKLGRINLSEKDLDYLEGGENSDDSISEDWLKKLEKKSREMREVLEELAKTIFYRDGFLYFDSQSIDELVHIALSLGGRFYSLFPKVDLIRGPRSEDEFLVATNIVDRKAFSPEGQEIPFPAILVFIESSAKRENGEEVKLTHKSEEGAREVGPMRLGFGFMIDLSNTIIEKMHEGSLFHEYEIIESVEFYPDKGEKYLIVEKYDSYVVYLKAKVNFKSGAMWCPMSFSYLRMEERVLKKEDEFSLYVPKVFFTSLSFESPESKDLGLDKFIDVYKPLLKDKKTDIGKLIENILPSDSLVMSIVSSHLGFYESKKYEFIRPPFHLYDGEKYEKEYLMESLIKHSLISIAVPKPEEKTKDKEVRKKSNQRFSISYLDLYKYFISNTYSSGIIGEKIIYPFIRTVLAEIYLSGGKSDLCLSHGEERVRIFPKSWEKVEDEIIRHLPFKKVDEAEPWEYKSEKVETHLKEETMSFMGYIDAYFAEKTKLAVDYEERVKDRIRKGLFYSLSWATLANLKEIEEEIGDFEKIRKRLFEE
jgi:hypothetical protein